MVARLIQNTMNTIMKNANKFHVLSMEEQVQLTEEYARTRSIVLRNKLVNHNLRLAIKITSEFFRQPNADALSEACIGLIQGVEKFDPNRQVRLSTYLTYWVRAYLFTYLLRNAKMVQIATTESKKKLFFNLKKIEAKLAAEGKEVTPEAIAQHLNVSEKDVVDMEQRMAPDTHLDKQVGEDGATHLDFLACDAMSPDEAFADAQRTDIIHRHFDEFRSSLSDREKLLFNKRLEDQSLREVGDELGLSYERIRQIENKLKKRFKMFCQKRNLRNEI